LAADEVRIAATDDPDELRSLIKWLRNEGDLRSRLTLQDAALAPGHMGGALDCISLTLGGSGIGTVFVKSLFTYLGQRRKAVVLDLRIKREDGRELELKLTNDKSAEATLDAAIRFLDAPE
jgi:hypothetical protein